MLGWNRLVTFTNRDSGEVSTPTLARVTSKRVRDSGGAVVQQWTVEIDALTRYPSGTLIGANDVFSWERFPGIVRTGVLGKPTPDLTFVGPEICFPFTEQN